MNAESSHSVNSSSPIRPENGLAVECAKPPTRRTFLGATAAVAAAGSLGPLTRAWAELDPANNPRSDDLSRVVWTKGERVFEGANIRRPVLADMLDRSLCTLTRTGSSKDAWRSILKMGDVVGVKFNRSGQSGLGTTPLFADVLLTSLLDSGWNADQIVCIEAPEGTVSKYGTQPMVEGYAPRETDFGSGADRFACVLDQVTALINVPFLKSHNIAGMTGCLKNLSHGLIKHPGRFHADGCNPFIADIVAAPPIRSKLRICVVDAMRVVCDGGPNVVIGGVRDVGGILMSTDPVAADLVGLSLLNDLRSRHGMTRIRMPTKDGGDYLEAASARGLGRSEWHQVELIKVEA